jgi:hypothetical protein
MRQPSLFLFAFRTMTTMMTMKTATVLLTLLSITTGSHAFVMPGQNSLVVGSKTVSNKRTSAHPLNLLLVPSTDVLDHAASSLLLLSDAATTTTTDLAAPPGEYSKLSYYTVLGLYVMSFPGLWSQIKRSTSAKIKRKTYVSPGEKNSGGKDLRSQAGEIMACEYMMRKRESVMYVCTDSLSIHHSPPLLQT